MRDAIGRTKKVKADKQGCVKLTLSGSPLIVYGLGAPVPAPGASSVSNMVNRYVTSCGFFDKKAKLRVVNIYGEEQKVAVRNGQATVKANDIPLVLIGCREVVP